MITIIIILLALAFIILSSCFVVCVFEKRTNLNLEQLLYAKNLEEVKLLIQVKEYELELREKMQSEKEEVLK